MESNLRYYERRAVEEAGRAARALTAESGAWHKLLSEHFRAKAEIERESKLSPRAA